MHLGRDHEKHAQTKSQKDGEELNKLKIQRLAKNFEYVLRSIEFCFLDYEIIVYVGNRLKQKER